MKKAPKQYLLWLVESLVVWVQHRLSRIHILNGRPQLALYAFDHVGTRVAAHGRYEDDEITALLEFLADNSLIAGDCIDAGANVGNHTLAFAGHYRSVHAFEPGARPFALLSVNGGSYPNIVVNRVGLSSNSRTAILVSRSENIGEGRIADDHTAEEVGQLVSLVAVDDYVAQHGLQIGLLKIDVEGHELMVLEGALTVLNEHAPVVALEEVPSNDSGSECIRLLRSQGYSRFYEIVKSPSLGFKPLTMLACLFMGQTCQVRLVGAFTRKYYPMIVAVSDKSTIGVRK